MNFLLNFVTLKFMLVLLEDYLFLSISAFLIPLKSE
jgi:hypothetical protein